MRTVQDHMAPFTLADDHKVMVGLRLAAIRGLAAIRDGKEMSGPAFARTYAGSAQAHWNRERGVNLISLDSALRIREIYKVSLDWLYRGRVGGLPYDAGINLIPIYDEQVKAHHLENLDPADKVMIGMRLLAVRLRSGKGAVNFAKTYNSLPQSHWSREQGINRIAVKDAMRFADAHNVSLDWVYLGDTGGMDPALQAELLASYELVRAREGAHIQDAVEGKPVGGRNRRRRSQDSPPLAASSEREPAKRGARLKTRSRSKKRSHRKRKGRRTRADADI